MNHAETIAAIPPAGWALLFCALILIAVVLVGLYRILLKKEAREEVRTLEAERVRYSTGDLISAQFSLSSNLLRKVGTSLYEADLKHLPLEDDF